jgi:HK97 family phage major capsid protein
MRKLIELKETRAAKLAEAKTFLDKDGDEARTKFDAIDAEIRALDADILRHEKLADMERRADAEPVGGREMQRELRDYSVAAAIFGAASGRLAGREAEVHQELSRGREARAGAGIHVAVPSAAILGETRAGQTVGNDPSGGYLVGTQVGPLADRMRPALRMEAMGATILRGLTMDIDLPKLASSGTANWIGENGAATRSEVGFSMVSMRPRTISGEYKMSRRLMLQTGASIEAILRRDLGFILAQGLDLAAINGLGASGQPLGLLQAGIELVATTTSGGGPDFGTTSSDLIAALELDDVTGTRAFLTNPYVVGLARKRLDGEGRLIPISEQFHGERIEVSTQVPDNIGGGSNKSALICGHWGEMVMGYWSAVDVLVNPYHADVASSGGALLHAFLDADVAVRHLEAFSYAEI